MGIHFYNIHKISGSYLSVWNKIYIKIIYIKICYKSVKKKNSKEE